MSNLEQRIQCLEDIEAIKQLKSKYLHACDQKDINKIRDCFAADTVNIDYGAIGKFNNREQLLDLFTEMAVKTNVIDAHFGQNPQIEIVSALNATATWDLYFSQINPDTRQITQIAGYYKDQYKKVNNSWVITDTIFTVRSSINTSYENAALAVMFAGNPLQV